MRRGLAVLALAILGTACGGAASEPEAVSTAAPADTGDSAAGTVPAGGASTASCVEMYSLDNLKKRDYAFDGTVSKIEPAAADGPDQVTFKVNEWFKGGDGETAMRQATGFGAVTSTGGEPREVGDRLLVAGDDDFAWDCGFTQEHSASVAADWKAAF